MWRSVAVLVLAAAAWAADEVVVKDTSGDRGLAYTFVRNGDSYVHGDVRVPATHVATLRRLALDAPGVPETLPEELGVTKGRLEEMECYVVEAALQGLTDYVPAEIPAGLEHVVSFEAVTKAARETFLDPGTDSHDAQLLLELPGDPPIVLRTESESAWMQPWHVKAGDGAERTVVSIALSKAVALFADARGPSARHLDGARYWRDEFWKDPRVWEERVGRPIVDHHARVLCAGLAGWEEVLRRMRVTGATIGLINQQPLSLQVDLDCTTKGLIDRIRWWNAYDGTDPGHDGNDLLEALDAAERVAEGLPFLGTWKAADPERHIAIDIVGRVGHAETDVPTFVQPAWDDSGLEGRPEFELTLHAGPCDWCTVWLSTGAKGALLLKADATFPDAKGIWFHPQKPEYAIVTPDGKVTRRKLGP